MTLIRLFRPKLALAVTLAAIATTPAAAQVTRSAGPFVSPTIQQDSHPGCSAVFGACSGGYTTAAAHPSVQGVTHSDGFDWGDAGIGAAAGFGLSMLGLGGAIKVSQYRAPRPTAVATS